MKSIRGVFHMRNKLILLAIAGALLTSGCANTLSRATSIGNDTYIMTAKGSPSMVFQWRRYGDMAGMGLSPLPPLSMQDVRQNRRVEGDRALPAACVLLRAVRDPAL